MARYASIDVGTNSVLLLVADKDAAGKWASVVDRAEITRLGKGVDKSRALLPEQMEATVKVLEAFTAEARELGAKAIVASATSAARDASNGPDFLRKAKVRTGLDIEIIDGVEEARLSYASAHDDFGGGAPLIVIDIGGGSTEFIVGDIIGRVQYRHSFDVGSVRLTERFGMKEEPIRNALHETFSELPDPPSGFRLVGVAGTVTTVLAVSRQIEPYDPSRVHGAVMQRAEVEATTKKLWKASLGQRKKMPGLQPKRADVIPAGALVLEEAMVSLRAKEITVSDRGLRWGLLADRFRGAS
jgi:exopolyphosphatase/guanosine-5'-triphosphate,3'-diphosphate pyrophosphatase